MIYPLLRSTSSPREAIFILALMLFASAGCEKNAGKTRKDISGHLSYLKAKYEANPVQNAPDLDEIIASLHSDSAFTRTFACGMLRELGKDARKAIPALTKVLSGSDAEFKREAGRALGEIVTNEKEAINGLIACLIVEDESLVRIAAESLGKIGVKTQEVVSALETASLSSSAETAEAAKRALKNLGVE